MQYLLLIYDAESNLASHTEEENAAVFREYGQFTQEIRRSGHYLGGNALQPVGTATSVRIRDGKTLITDGPFAETHEQLGGYYLIEAADLDSANALALRIPAARTGSIEVRPIMPVDAH